MRAVNFAKVILLPLFVLAAGFLLIVVVACLITFGSGGEAGTWTFLGVVDVPSRSKAKILAATVAGLAVAAFAYGSYVRGVVAALRKNRMTLSDFVDLPWQKRRALMSGPREHQGESH